MRHGWVIALVLLSLPAQAETLVVTADQCRTLTRHVPAPDVSYQPGVDADGQEVAPADLPGSVTLRPAERFSIDITVRLDRRFALPATPELYRGEVRVGQVEWRDGSAWFDGQRLDDEATAALLGACAKGLTPAKP